MRLVRIVDLFIDLFLVVFDVYGVWFKKINYLGMKLLVLVWFDVYVVCITSDLFEVVVVLREASSSFVKNY